MGDGSRRNGAFIIACRLVLALVAFHCAINWISWTTGVQAPLPRLHCVRALYIVGFQWVWSLRLVPILQVPVTTTHVQSSLPFFIFRCNR